MKKNLPENEVIFHEIQSAYFGNSTFSIFTASGYILDHRKEFSKLSIAVVSECSDHSRMAALICVDMVLKIF